LKGVMREHVAIAALVKEGLVKEILSANWDGLIENASAAINGGERNLKVCVRSEDLKAPDSSATLIKFHGCAICAKDDEHKYREFIVGNQGKIDSWSDDVPAITQHLKDVAVSRPTLLLGLSVQDENIRKVFNEASSMVRWEWPGELPAYVMSENDLGEMQNALLQNVYREQYNSANRTDIKKSAHLPAFAKPLLSALLLFAYSAKLRRISQIGKFSFSNDMEQWVHEGLNILRDKIATAGTADHKAFVDCLIKSVTRAKHLFLSGEINSTDRYEPLTQKPVDQMKQDLTSETDGTAEATVIVAALAKGDDSGDWELNAADTPDPNRGTAQITQGSRTDRVFIIAGQQAENALYDSGAIVDTDNDVLLIHSPPLQHGLPRSPTRAPGRTGLSGPRRVSTKALLDTCNNSIDFMREFRLEAGL